MGAGSYHKDKKGKRGMSKMSGMFGKMMMKKKGGKGKKKMMKKGRK